MNSLTITGNLGRDSEIKQVGEQSVCTFSVGDSQGKDKSAIWWNCSLWGKRGESLSQYLTKGQQVTVIGTVTEREWTDKEGNNRKTMEVKVSDVALQGGKREEKAFKPASQDAFKARQLAPQQYDNDEPPF